MLVTPLRFWEADLGSARLKSSQKPLRALEGYRALELLLSGWSRPSDPGLLACSTEHLSPEPPSLCLGID